MKIYYWIFSCIFDFLFRQINSLERAALIRVTLGLIVVVLLHFAPYNEFYVDAAPILYVPKGIISAIPALDFNSYYFLKSLVFISAIFCLLGLFSRIAVLTLTISFFIFNGYIAHFSTVWNYNTHINFFLVALNFTRSGEYYSIDRLFFRRDTSLKSTKERERASIYISFVQFFVALIYWNAGYSKLIKGGLKWFTEGESIFSFMALTAQQSNSNLGLELAIQPLIARIMGISTGIFELGFILALSLFSGSVRLGLISLAFHCVIHSSMNVPFFHLWFLYPALFLFHNGSLKVLKRPKWII